jgi:ribosomal protein S18 acetylase RimI-like enzyme
MYQDERDNTEWRRIQRGVDEFRRVDDDLFEKEFLSKGVEEVKKRVFFVAKKTGDEEELVGSIAAWWVPSWRDGEDYGRIHWVAIAKKYQGKGLGKAMTQKAINCLKALGHKRAFLVTHTRRTIAIKMYAGFGFVPDLHEPKDKGNWAKVPMFADYVAAHN